MKIRATGCAILLAASLLLSGCGAGLYGTEIYRYSDTGEIKVTKSSEDVVAKINIKDTYTKSEQTYYEITTTATGNKVYTFSEEEYDKLFGLENDAFDCTIYTLTVEADVLQYDDFFPSATKLTAFTIEDLNSYKDNPFDIELLYMSSLFDGVYHDTMKCETLCIEDKVCKIKKNDYKLYTYIYEERYSFEDQDFSQEEIDAYVEELDMLNKHILEAFDMSK